MMRYLVTNSLSIRLRAYTPFYSWSWYYTTLFKAVGVVGVHPFSTAGLGILLPVLRRLVLSSPTVTGEILQQSALPSLYSAVGGGTALFGRYTTHHGAVGISLAINFRQIDHLKQHTACTNLQERLEVELCRVKCKVVQRVQKYVHCQPSWRTTLCNLCDCGKIDNLKQHTGCANFQKHPRLNYVG